MSLLPLVSVELVIGEAEEATAFEAGADVALNPGAFLWRQEKLPVKMNPDMDEDPGRFVERLGVDAVLVGVTHELKLLWLSKDSQ